MKVTCACATCLTTPEAVAFARGKTRADLDANRQLNLSLVRLLEIVGEAAARLPAEERAHHPKFRGLRLSVCATGCFHGYDSVDFDILWRIVTN
jgi:uncharacterized protein with HEPN domain